MLAVMKDTTPIPASSPAIFHEPEEYWRRLGVSDLDKWRFLITVRVQSNTRTEELLSLSVLREPS